ncbi:hypothetical protein M407DRAFT_31439 [Tulasnella calospora MUT 4182]|uniref:Uncharacterized protein n=1 Tax=Tulasnella calospora MUT 4182 TaxID=1051891 RepID=A0A0C3PVC6_9AGAM|nr:hypothetical protein M407DRAFT_31439 [Tulasnella calospora MUT 4182]
MPTPSNIHPPPKPPVLAIATAQGRIVNADGVNTIALDSRCYTPADPRSRTRPCCHTRPHHRLPSPPHLTLTALDPHHPRPSPPHSIPTTTLDPCRQTLAAAPLPTLAAALTLTLTTALNPHHARPPPPHLTLADKLSLLHPWPTLTATLALATTLAPATTPTLTTLNPCCHNVPNLICCSYL